MVRQNQKIKVYSCGPTVYDFAHIGNFRAYIFTDTLVRFLKFKKLRPYLVMNITDIDDKTISGAKKKNKKLALFTKEYENAFFEDLKKLNVLPANKYPRATENIKEIQNLITVLYKKGFAYEKDGSVYFDIKKFPKYGQLSKIVLDEKSKQSRLSQDNYDKNTPADFVLWKKSKAGEPSWKLKLMTNDKRQATNLVGRPARHATLALAGRPGWHIECSAMAMKYLGPQINIHLGGVDLMFPHHENEIAQSEAATDRQFARFFLHNEHLLSDNEKMSKSLGNFYTLRDLISRGFDPLSFRYLCLQAHYRSKMNFSFASLRAAENALGEIRKLGQRQSNSRTHPFIRLSDNPIIKALEDDLDTPKALSILHQENDFRLWEYFEPVLGFGLLGIRNKEIGIRGEVKDLINKRQQLRKAGKFAEADKIRKEIESKGYEIEDTEKGPRILKT